MNRKLLKIGVGVAVPLSVAGLVTGLVIGLRKEDSSTKKKTNIIPQSVQYFRKQIISSGMQNAFLYPRNGKNLLNNFILLDNKKFDTNKINKIITNKKALYSLKINFNDFYKKQDIDKKMFETNNSLLKFATDNSSKRLGLHWNSNAALDSIEINVYEIKPVNQKDKALIDNYLKYLKSTKIFADTWSNKRSSASYGPSSNKIIDFPRTMASGWSMGKSKLQDFYPFDIKSSSGLNIFSKFSTIDPIKKNGKILSIFKTVNLDVHQTIKSIEGIEEPKESNKDDWETSNMVWKEHGKKDMKIPYYSKFLSREFNVELLKNKIIVIINPSINFSESKLSVNFTFYKLGEDSEINFIGLEDEVKNPENVYFEKIDFDLKNDIFSKLGDKKSNSVISNDKQNKDNIFNAIKNNWVKFVDKKSAVSLLSQIDKFIPTIGTTLRDFIGTFEFLSKIKDENISSKSALSHIFKDPYDTKQVKKKTLLDRIIDKANNSDYLEPTRAFNIWFKKENNGKYYITPDTNIMQFTSTDNYFVKSPGKLQISTQKLLYYIYAGAKAFEPLIRERLNMLVEKGSLKNDFYDTITIDAIDAFISNLKEKNVIGKDFSMLDLKDASKRNKALSKIVKAIQENKDISIPSELFGYFAKIDGKISLLLSKVINSNYASDILTLIIGKDEPGKALNDVLKDPLNALVSRVMKNIDMETKALDNLSKKAHIKDLLKPLIPENFLPIINKLFDGFGDKESFEESLAPIISIVPESFKKIAKQLLVGALYKDEGEIVINKGLSKSSINEVKGFLVKTINVVSVLKSFSSNFPPKIASTLVTVMDFVQNKLRLFDKSNKPVNDNFEKLAKLLKALI